MRGSPSMAGPRQKIRTRKAPASRQAKGRRHLALNLSGLYDGVLKSQHYRFLYLP